MNKRLLSLGLLLTSDLGFAQVGIGTMRPDDSALLDVKAGKDDLKGILIPRVPLLSVTDNSNINKGHVANSLLVFNTTNNAELKAGFYYWFDSRWIRLLGSEDSAVDGFPVNEELAVDIVKKTLYLRDSADNIVSVPLVDINILTALLEKGQGVYEYIAEDGSTTKIDVAADVITTISTILNDQTVIEEIHNVVSANAKDLVSSDGSLVIVGGQKATLNAASIDIAARGVTSEKVADQAITVEKIKGRDTQTILATNKKGEVEWLELGNPIIRELVRRNESLTVLEVKPNGTFTYFNEREVDQYGNILPSVRGTIFDANTLSIDSSKPGIYVFTNKSSSKPLATINTRANAIIFEDNTTIEYNNVEEAITNILNQLDEVSHVKGKLEGDGILINDKPVMEAISVRDIMFSIADNAITTGKIADQAVTTAKIGSVTDGTVEEANSVILSDGIGGVYYESVHTVFEKKAYPLEVNEPIEISSGDNQKALLSPITLVIQDKGITERYIGDKSVTQDKLVAPVTAVVGDVPAVQLDNSVKYVSVANAVKQNAANITSTDKSILLNGGGSVNKSVLANINLSLNDNAVSTSKVQNHAVTEEKMWAGENKENYVAAAQADGSVQYLPIHDIVEGEPLTVDNSLEIVGAKDSSRVLLNAMGLRIRDNGVITDHLEDKAVTAAKIGSGDAAKDAVLAADGTGVAEFRSISNVIAPVMLGDMLGDRSILVTGGENTVIGNAEKKVVFQINDGGVLNKHLATGSVSNDKVANTSIQAEKLNAQIGAANRVAIAGADGKVTYGLLDASTLGNKGTVSTDGIVTVDKGNSAVLSDFTLGIAHKSIPASKLTAETDDVGKVATVNPDGTVSYQSLAASSISGGAALTTDAIIKVDGGDTAEGVLLKEVKLSVADQGITTAKIADNAITTTKIADQAVSIDKISSINSGGAKRVIVSGADNTAKWVELDQIMDHTSGDLIGDSTISVSDGGVGALLKDVELGVKDGSITKRKLSSVDDNNPGTNIVEDRVLLTDGQGGFIYAPLNAIQVKGEDLSLGNALEFISGDGKKTVLSQTSIRLKDLGITTEKLANQVVTTAKLSSEGTPSGYVLHAKGDGTVEYKEVNSSVFSGNEGNLLSDSSLVIPPNNQAVLKDTHIAIAVNGVQNKHIGALSVSPDKLSTYGADANTVLTADGKGKANYAPILSLVEAQAQAMSAADGSITLDGGYDKALLKASSIRVSDSGILNKHIGAREITTNKLSSEALPEGLILFSDGDGGVVFDNFSSAIDRHETFGKALLGEGGIRVMNGEHILLRDAKISIADKGVTNAKLADKTITAVKFNAGSSPAGAVLTSLGDGEVQYLPMGNYGQALTSDNSIKVTKGAKALLNPASIEVNEQGILTKHIGAKQVTVNKLSSVVNGTSTAADKVLMSDGNGGMVFGSVNLGVGDLMGTNTIDVVGGDNALLNDVTVGVRDNSISTRHLMDKGVTESKLGSKVGQANYVGVTDGNGGVLYQSISNIMANNSGELSVLGALEIASGNGKKAIHNDVSIRVKNKGITTNLIADAAVTDIQVAANAITTPKVLNKNITPEKIGSLNAKSGAFLVADGAGSAQFKELKAMMPKFFYLPSIYLDMTPEFNGTKNIYEEYVTQFGTPKLANPGAGNQALLPVLPVSELNFIITYYDEAVFENVTIGDNGMLNYNIKQNAEITGKSFMNIVLAVKE